MPELIRPTISEVVTSFLLVHGDAPDVFRRLDSFMTNLSCDPVWDADEVAEIYNRLIERLTS
jgi:hypothetical protein